MDEFLEYLKQKPQLYPLIKSTTFIQVLETLSIEAVQEDKLSSKFQKIKAFDLKEILEVLQKLELVKKMSLRGTIFYFVTNEGRTFLEKYKKGYKEFGVTEKSP